MVDHEREALSVSPPLLDPDCFRLISIFLSHIEETRGRNPEALGSIWKVLICSLIVNSSAQAMSSDSPSPSFPKTPSTSTSPFSTLPNEIVQLIIGSSFPDGPYFAIYHLRQPVLYSLSLVSRLFRGIAQPLLFEIASTEGDMDHGTAKHEVLMLICLTNPNFSHYLKSVYFEDTGKDNWVFCRLVNSVMEECRSLASLTIRGDPPLMLWDYLAQRPSVF